MSYAETRAKAKDIDERFRQLSERQKINALYFLWGYVAASEDPAGCESAITYVERYFEDER